MGKARLSLAYRLPKSNLIKEGKQITHLGEVFDRIKQKHNLEREPEVTTTPHTSGEYTISIKLVQEPQIIRAALEDLIDSEIGVPDRVYTSNYLREEPKEKDEKLGFEIAKEVFGSAGYELKPYRLLFFLMHYDIKKRNS